MAAGTVTRRPTTYTTPTIIPPATPTLVTISVATNTDLVTIPATSPLVTILTKTTTHCDHYSAPVTPNLVTIPVMTNTDLVTIPAAAPSNHYSDHYDCNPYTTHYSGHLHHHPRCYAPPLK